MWEQNSCRGVHVISIDQMTPVTGMHIFKNDAKDYELHAVHLWKTHFHVYFLKESTWQKGNKHFVKCTRP